MDTFFDQIIEAFMKLYGIIIQYTQTYSVLCGKFTTDTEQCEAAIEFRTCSSLTDVNLKCRMQCAILIAVKSSFEQHNLAF